MRQEDEEKAEGRGMVRRESESGNIDGSRLTGLHNHPIALKATK
jgi:hypothetical protein